MEIPAPSLPRHPPPVFIEIAPGLRALVLGDFAWGEVLLAQAQPNPERPSPTQLSFAFADALEVRV